MKQVRLLIAGLFFAVLAYGQENDSVYIPAITLSDVSIIDFKNDNHEVFKSMEANIHSAFNNLNSDLGDLIQNTTPVYFKNYSVGGIKTIDFRGTGAERTKVYWNGFAINSPTLGSFDFSLFPVYFISDARIRFGGAGLSDGSGGLGGSIQLNNPLEFNKNKLEISGIYGSFENYSLAARGEFVIGKIKSDTRILTSSGRNNYSYRNEFKKGHPTENRINNEFTQIGFQQLLGFDLGLNNYLTVRLMYNNLDRNIPPPVSATSGGAWQSDQLLLTQIEYDLIPFKRAFLKLRSGYQMQDNRYNLPGVVDATTRINGWNNKVDFGYDWSNKLQVNGTLQFDRSWIKSDGVGNITENLYNGLINANWRVIVPLKLAFGFRVNGISKSTPVIMPYGGLVWEISPTSGNLRLNISEVYRFPTINERYWKPGGNPDLLPERGWNYELGYSYKKKLGIYHVSAGITGFYSDIDNWILWTPSSNNSAIWEPQNIWNVIDKGMEFVFNFNFRPTGNIEVETGLNYSYTHVYASEIKNGNPEISGKQLLLSPQNQFTIPISIRWKKLETSLFYSYVGKRYTDRLNTRWLDPYNLLDIAIGYSFFNRNLGVKLLLNNLLNIQYQTTPGQPLAGINFNMELTWKIF